VVITLKLSARDLGTTRQKELEDEEIKRTTLEKAASVTPSSSGDEGFYSVLQVLYVLLASFQVGGYLFIWFCLTHGICL
jgi:hypothetical protein